MPAHGSLSNTLNTQVTLCDNEPSPANSGPTDAGGSEGSEFALNTAGVLVNITRNRRYMAAYCVCPLTNGFVGWWTGFVLGIR